MHKKILTFMDSLVTTIIVLILCIIGLYAAFALWDNNQVYSAAQNVQDDMLKLKPVITEDGGASFEELLEINPDVCAWLTLDNTNIDYPVVQGETVLTYINTDVYGNFSLAGSIFLDPQCKNDFSDAYSLVYGHHMENHQMFGDLDLYKEEAFFNENTTGTLILPDKSYKLEIFACLTVASSDDQIFDPTKWQTDIDGLLSYAKSNAIQIHTKTIDEQVNPQVIALSTCSSEYTDARTIVLAFMNEK